MNEKFFSGKNIAEFDLVRITSYRVSGNIKLFGFKNFCFWSLSSKQETGNDQRFSKGTYSERVAFFKPKYESKVVYIYFDFF